MIELEEKLGLMRDEFWEKLGLVGWIIIFELI